MKRAGTLIVLVMLLAILSAEAYAADIAYYGREALGTLENAEALDYAYQAIVQGVETSEKEIVVYNGTDPISAEEIQTVIEAYDRDHTEQFWFGLNNGYQFAVENESVYAVYPNYALSGTALTSARDDFENAIDEIMLGITDSMDDFEKEVYLHDRLAESVVYDLNATNAHNAYGALVEGSAVCEGYAEAFQCLLHRAGIRSFIMVGDSLDAAGSFVGHAWNAVEIDGQFYHADLTWDDQDDTVFHAYFNLSDEQIQVDHWLDETAYPLPVCSASDAHYFEQNPGKLTEYDVQTVAQLLKNDHLSARFYMDGELSPDGFWAWFKEEISNIASAVGIRGGLFYRMVNLGNEVGIALIPSDTQAITAEVKFASEQSITLTVFADGTEAGSLYIAVYDAEGRMLNCRNKEQTSLTVFGNDHTVFVDGEAATVKVFFADPDTGIPFFAVEEIEK